MEFRGHKIFTLTGYPAVWWPDHYVSVGQGIAYVHRIVAYEKYGDAVKGMAVHHINGDKWNWSLENLELMTNSEHGKLHAPLKRKNACEQCRIVFLSGKTKKERKYCSLKCARKAREKIQWPPIDEVLQMVQNTNYSAAGRVLGVSATAVRGRLSRRNRL